MNLLLPVFLCNRLVRQVKQGRFPEKTEQKPGRKIEEHDPEVHGTHQAQECTEESLSA